MVCRRVHLFVLGLELLKVMAKDYPNARAALSVAWLDMCIILNFELQDNQCMHFGLSRLDSILQRNSCKLSYPLRRHMSRTCSPRMCTCLSYPRISPCNIYCNLFGLQEAVLFLYRIVCTLCSPFQRRNVRTYISRICKGLWWDLRILLDISRTSFYLLFLETFLPRICRTLSALDLGRLLHMGTYRMSIDPF